VGGENLSCGVKETREPSEPREHVEHINKAGAPDECNGKCDVTPMIVVPHKGDGESTANLRS